MTARHATEQDPRWAAIVARDAKADLTFVYGVKTTGVYCRPSSSARRPRPENVEFFDTPQQAEAAGYRPNKRASGDQTQVAARHAQLVAAACRHIEQAETLPPLEDLAALAGLSPFHFHRVFKAVTGLTPKRYGSAHRSRKVRDGLKGQHSVTDALYDAGFNSNSRFYEAADQLLGMKPRDYKAGGTNTDIRFAVGQCSLGAILVAQSNRGVCAILLGDDPDKLVRDLQDQFPRANLLGADHDFEQLIAQVVGFIEAPALGLDLPLDLRGTAFQERVWQALREIPVGCTASYAEIAQRIGAPTAYRAVAQACGANSLAVAIPCHRVVRADGNLSGYRWGVERKRQLLERESPAES
ncbi:MAG: bifunctional DNA-binding transcriptional regulator/O6-methylguanine-DNA methyltransferase Ada [Pseudomonas sp.]|jgi:AraC family transcriptional regulator of adaptative response/methylated-DNA-[protein]-cysteine methyltransferase|uniref:bifunctional DNA-binding transcriptional regulator/O6-methylguanine-DNA methyltransferase Ada n=1 Tax=Pseudomonas sp. TaxID=306 RepID=UPI00239217C3|nr:bifunctional DNA-binding transcriptional regulator/O6-methylguanine-DNA methyltransferase Ada [Pseudomonas sp.]MDP9058622.1 bifunctional DNA-binding transcriptional regulator/O6-methylguanine-DNA methyltransferase Ada [Pseudomonadota bacterium]MDE1908884.1 bifunctional DNA-binding transcriptional regulator/O6-methylguanine-DNA methyltransferase Ada [Pseudomonas sp.]MDE2035036.1 bifunctional DNA-binding transcriptional regulator/O6-methylguanine-DNA methyltransferase Ada [Pseudomonas sp.]MDE2